jgi:hypothetical protein
MIGDNTLKKMKKLWIAIVASIAAVLLSLTVALPANAYWYNTVKNNGTQTIKVINTDGKYFSIAPGNSASDVHYVYVGARQRATMQPAGAGATVFPCNLPGHSGYILVGSFPFNTVNVKVTNC